MSKAFVSQADLEEKRVSFTQISEYADPRVWNAERDRQMWEALES
jgi:hypothetical protein